MFDFFVPPERQYPFVPTGTGRSFSLYHVTMPNTKFLKCLQGLSAKGCMYHGLAFAKKAPTGQVYMKKLTKHQAFEETKHHSSKAWVFGTSWFFEGVCSMSPAA